MYLKMASDARVGKPLPTMADRRDKPTDATNFAAAYKNSNMPALKEVLHA